MGRLWTLFPVRSSLSKGQMDEAERLLLVGTM